MFGFEYTSVKNDAELSTALDSFYDVSDNPKLLEIFTPSTENDKILLDYWNIGIWEYWNIGILENWNIGISEWNIENIGKSEIGILEYWKAGTLEDWNVGILKYGNIECWNIGISEYWNTGILEKLNIGILE